MASTMEHTSTADPLIHECPQNQHRATPHVKNLYLLSFSFLFVFLAYGATQNLESSLNADENLGLVSLGTIYLSFSFFAIGAPLPVRWLGAKHGILLGLSGYWLFMFANLLPSWYTMIPASLFLGFSAALLWVAEGAYITQAAKLHAADLVLDEENVIGKFNGVFWSCFACNRVIGNLMSFTLLQTEEGASDTASTAWPLLGTFLGCMSVGTMIASFLGSQPKYSREDDAKKDYSWLNFMRSTLFLLVDKKLLLLLPLLIYSGLQQAFIWGDFTESIITPAFGVAMIGGVMAAFGAIDAVFSLLAGWLSAGISSIATIIFIGAAAQLLVIVWLIFKESYQKDMIGYSSLFGMAMLWGIGDAVFNTQISALLGILYPDIAEAAFSQWRIWQSVASAVVFFGSSYTVLHTKLMVLVITLTISVITFMTLRFTILKKRFLVNSRTC